MPSSTPTSYQTIAKTTTAATLGGVFLLLSGLTLAVTVVGLVAATPALVVFSPVIISAACALSLILSGLAVSGVCGTAASFLLYWMYCYAASRKAADIAAGIIAGGDYDERRVPVEVEEEEDSLGRDIDVD
ncbi:hypothetical protein DM860_001833 [Cuscuta australis]|uniref:Oleosin n=1 Tax=Cuscuta australis TaxID=267555 RepID=A0A328E9G8_9ASTE|nr:hypothetical protein DM860_001833 [Cuscuta australis]